MRVRHNEPLDPEVLVHFAEAKQEAYLAQVVRWWALAGGGDTPQQARAALASAFDSMKAARLEGGKPLPRPGTSVPVEFAPRDLIFLYPNLQEEFVRLVLEIEWAFLTDESSLWDFHTEGDNEALVEKVRDVYGVDVSDIKSGNLVEIFERIAASRRQ